MPLVLIVDDEPGLLNLFTNLLNRLECEAVAVRSGGQALDVLAQETPDLLILDLAMPDITGFDVLQAVRDTPRLDRMRVMILTARPNLVPEVEAMGIDGWMAKPVLPGDFIDEVTAILWP